MTRPRRSLPGLLVGLVGFAASMTLVGLGVYGIHLMVTFGVPVRLAMWRPYLLLFAGMLASLAVAYASFRLLERLGVRPPMT